MKNIVRTTLALALGFVILGQAAESRGTMSAAAQNEAATLAALIRAPSFQEADRLAAKLLADPAIDSQTTALCGLAVLKAGRIKEEDRIGDPPERVAAAIRLRQALRQLGV